jgi:hypothetical protein
VPDLREHGTGREGVGVTEGVRATGWYPDPWGTDHERYFDGSAWARETRPVGGADEATSTPAVGGTPTPTAPPPTLGDPPVTASPGPASDAGPGAAPAAWHRDPWGLAAMRWWDGAQWTGYVSGPPPARVAAPDLAGERGLARWLRPALLAGGVAQAVTLVTSVDQAQWIVDHWGAITRPGGGEIPTMPASTSSSLGQLSGVIGFAVAILFMLWFYRAASTGWSSGVPARRGPMIATLSFIIPILNLWWPYQAALDMVPAGDPNRGVIRRWWALWLAAMLCGLLIYPAAAVYTETAARVVAGVGALAMLAAAFAARAVVEYVTATHEHLGGVAAAG